MENASKALIIAGAILLAILLISLGIMIFNQASDTVSNSGMTEAEITSFNNKFLKYEGIQKGTMVRALCQEAMANNSESSNADRKVVVKAKYPAPGYTILVSKDNSTATTNVSDNSAFNVEMTYGDNGLITEIICTKQSPKSTNN